MADRAIWFGLSATLALVIVAASISRADDESNVLRDGFESEQPGWRQEKTDAEVRLFAHDRSDRAAREGTKSERFQFDAAVGSGFFWSYGLPKIPITPDLKVGLQVRSDRSGVQILGRVILPKDIDPETNQPSFVLVPGTILANADRWTRLELLDIPLGVERQARVLRATTKRVVSLEGAYLDRLVINLYGGPGATEVFLDDLRIGPVPAAMAKAPSGEAGEKKADALPPLPPALAGEKPAETRDADGKAKSLFKLNRSGLTRDGYPWLFTAIHAPGADPIKLRRAGFKVDIFSINAAPEDVEDAAGSGLVLMPTIPPGKDGEAPDPALVARMIDRFPAKDKVAFLSLGDGLGASNNLAARQAERDRVREVAQMIRKRSDLSALSGGVVTGLFPDYARVPDNLDLIGVRPFGWGTMQEPTETFKYLEQRRFLTALENADALIYSWIPLVPDPIFKRAIWGVDRPPSWGYPRVQPEQMRLAAFTALAAGCRGLAFEADSEITKGSGRPLLIEAALLNEEIDLLEWLLADTSKGLKMLPTYRPDPPPQAPNASGLGMKTNLKPPKEPGPHPTIRAAAFSTKDRRGTLLLIADYAFAGQFQPPQAAFKELQVEVPGPANAEAYLISPGDVRVLNRKRVPGGIRVSIPEFGPTSIVYVTTDGTRIREIMAAVTKVRPLAVNLVIEQAQLQYASVIEIHRLLVDDGHKIDEGDELLSLASESIKSAMAAQERQDYELAWNEARRALRPLQILMRAHWDLAIGAIYKILGDKDLMCGPETPPGAKDPLRRQVAPVAVPPMVSYYTLPQAWVWKDWIKNGRLGDNVLKGGYFDAPEDLADNGWTDESYQVEGLVTKASIVKEKQGGSFLELSAAQKDKEAVDALVPFQDHPVVAVRTPPIPVREAEIIRISAMVSMPTQAAQGAGGVIVRDSIGGEPLQFRQAYAIPGLQEVILYRRAPADGEMTVLLGYAGLQYARFDSLRIQKIIKLEDAPRRPVATRAQPARR